MTDIKRYSKEGLARNINPKQMDALKKISKKQLEDLKKQGDLSQKYLSIDTVFGSKEDAKIKYDFLKATNISPEEVELINKLGGIDNLFDIIDANGDGVVTDKEIIDMADVDTEEWTNPQEVSLSAKDISIVYENAMAAEGAIVTENEIENSTDYKFKDGSKSTVYRDLEGNVTYNETSEPLPKGGKKESLHDYINEETNEIIYDKKGRIKHQKTDRAGTLYDKTVDVKYKFGGKRVVTTTTVGRIVDREYDKNDKLISESTFFRNSSDGKIGNVKQQNIGDCWLLSQVKSLSDTYIGRQLIKDSIKINSDGSVTVSLQGVGLKYTYSPERAAAMDYSNSGGVYSKGDIDMRFIELAIGDFRKELMSQPEGDYLMGIFSSEATMEDPLNAGGFKEAIMCLTGIMPEDAMTSEEIEGQLQSKANYPDSYTLVTSFKNEDPDIGMFDANNLNIVTGHEYSISRVTDDTVFVVNPWDTSKEIEYPKDKFLENCEATSSVNLDQFYKRKLFIQ